MKRSTTLLVLALTVLMSLLVILPCSKISAEAAESITTNNVVSASEDYDYYSYDETSNGSPPSHGFFWLPLSLGLGAIIASIYAGSIKAQLHTVEQRTEANQYVLQNSLELSARSDQFLYRETSKTPISQGPSQEGGGFGTVGNPNSRPRPGNQIHKR